MNHLLNGQTTLFSGLIYALMNKCEICFLSSVGMAGYFPFIGISSIHLAVLCACINGNLSQFSHFLQLYFPYTQQGLTQLNGLYSFIDFIALKFSAG